MSNRYPFIAPEADVERATHEEEPLGTETDEVAEVTTQESNTEGVPTGGSPSKGDTPAKHPDKCSGFVEWLVEGLKDAFYSLRKD